MRISLIPQDSTLTALTLDGTINFPHGQRRMVRTKLVTGGSHISNRGQTVKDRQANFVLTLTCLEDEQTLEYWHTNRSLLMFSDDLGVYSCKIQSLTILQGVATIEMWILALIVSSADYIYPDPQPAPEWLDVTSDTYWEAYSSPPTYPGMTWDGSKWSGSIVGASGNTSFDLDPLGSEAAGWTLPAGSWVTDFRPTKFRIAYTYTNPNGASVTTNAARIQTFPDYDKLIEPSPPPFLPGVEYDIDWDAPVEPGTHDAISTVRPISFYAPTGTYSCSIEITKIEFYGVKTW